MAVKIDRVAAKKAGYTDKEIDQFIAQQEKGQRVSQINQPVNQPTSNIKGATGIGILDNILGFVAPRTANIVQDIRAAGEVKAQQPAQEAQYQKQLQGIQLAKQAAQTTDPAEKERLLNLSRQISAGVTNIDTSGFSQDIEKGYLDRGLGAGAELGVLASGGISGLSAAKSGMVLGGVLGATNPGADLTQRALGATGGAALGGITGKLLEGILKAPSKMQESGQALRQGVLKPKVSTSPLFAQEETALTQKATKLGLKGSAKAQSQQIGNIYKQSSTELGNILNKSKAKFNPAKIITDVSKKLEGEVLMDEGTIANKTFNKWLGKLNEGGTTPGASFINKLKFELQNELKPVYTKLMKGNPLTDQETVKLAFRDILDEAISGKVPATRPLLETLSTLHKLAPGLKKSTASSVKLPLWLGNIPGVNQPLQAGQDLLGRILGKAGNLGAGITSKVSPQVLTSPILTSILKPGQQTPQATPTAPETIAETTKEQLMQPQGQGMTITPQQMQQVELSDISEKTKDKIRAAYKLQTKTKTATALQVEGKAKAASDAINFIEQQLSANPNVLIQAMIPGSPGARQYEAAVSSITDAIGGLRTGASVSPQQQKFYRNLLPKVGDSPETIKYKLDALKAELSTYLQGSGSVQDQLIQ